MIGDRLVWYNEGKAGGFPWDNNLVLGNVYS